MIRLVGFLILAMIAVVVFRLISLAVQGMSTAQASQRRRAKPVQSNSYTPTDSSSSMATSPVDQGGQQLNHTPADVTHGSSHSGYATTQPSDSGGDTGGDSGGSGGGGGDGGGGGGGGGGD